MIDKKIPIKGGQGQMHLRLLVLWFFHFSYIYKVDKSVCFINHLLVLKPISLLIDTITNSFLAFVNACCRGFQIATKFA